MKEECLICMAPLEYLHEDVLILEEFRRVRDEIWGEMSKL